MVPDTQEGDHCPVRHWPFHDFVYHQLKKELILLLRSMGHICRCRDKTGN